MMSLDERISQLASKPNPYSEIKDVHPRHVNFWKNKHWREIGRAVLLNGFIAVYMVKGS